MLQHRYCSIALHERPKCIVTIFYSKLIGRGVSKACVYNSPLVRAYILQFITGTVCLNVKNCYSWYRLGNYQLGQVNLIRLSFRVTKKYGAGERILFHNFYFPKEKLLMTILFSATKEMSLNAPNMCS
jgi:hypothetical protein